MGPVSALTAYVLRLAPLVLDTPTATPDTPSLFPSSPLSRAQRFDHLHAGSTNRRQQAAKDG